MQIHIKKRLCNFLSCLKDILTVKDQEQYTQEDERFFKRFKEIKINSFRKNLIKQYARLVNMERMDMILSKEAKSITWNLSPLSTYLKSSTSKTSLITHNNPIITDVWNIEKLLNEQEYMNILNVGFRKDTNISGEYICYYDLLIVQNENHRVNRGIILDDVNLDPNTNRISFYDIDDDFIKVIISCKSYFDPKTCKSTKFNTPNEYKLYKMIQLDLEIRQNATP